jgi:Zinc ribbon domain
MPIYEHKRQSCGHVSESLAHSCNDNKDPMCPECGDRSLGGEEMQQRISNLNGRQARIALLAINEGNGIDEAIDIAVSYQQETANLDRVINRLRKE